MRPLPAILVLLAACDAPPDDEAPVDPVATAEAQGPHAVGYRRAEVVYTPAGLDGAARTLPVDVWYPAPEGTQGSPAPYRVAGVIEQAAPFALDAPAPADGPFPVAVYSHGSGGVGLLAYPYAERLASHGWVVVAPDHVGNSSLDLLTGEAAFGETALVRPQDVTAVLDAVEDAAVGLPDGLADPSAALLWGHSFGGYTTFAAGGTAVDPDRLGFGCAPDDDDPTCVILRDPDARAVLEAPADPRIVAVAPQAPALVPAFADGALAGLDVPVLLMSAGGDLTTPDATQAAPAWEALQGADDLWLRIPDGGHVSFISICADLPPELLATFYPTAEAEGCGEGAPDPVDLIATMTTYLLAFAEVHVRGDATLAPVLDATLSADVDRVTP